MRGFRTWGGPPGQGVQVDPRLSEGSGCRKTGNVQHSCIPHALRRAKSSLTRPEGRVAASARSRLRACGPIGGTRKLVLPLGGGGPSAGWWRGTRGCPEVPPPVHPRLGGRGRYRGARKRSCPKDTCRAAGEVSRSGVGLPAQRYAPRPQPLP